MSQDQTVTLELSGGAGLLALKNGEDTLVKGTDYAVSGNTVTIKESYLASLAAGEYTVLFDISAGQDLTLTITIEDSGVALSSAPPRREPPENLFSDVDIDDWFYEAVAYVSANGLMNGTGAAPAMFDPDVPLTRGMFVTVLYRHAGSPDVGALDAAPFGDVAGGSWYADAVKWAAGAGIVNGYGDGMLGPDDNITRQDLAVMLSRYTELAGIPLPQAREYTAFPDDADIADIADIANYAKDAIEAFFRAAVLNGYPDGGVHPNDEATRAELAAMLMRTFQRSDSHT